MCALTFMLYYCSNNYDMICFSTCSLHMESRKTATRAESGERVTESESGQSQRDRETPPTVSPPLSTPGPVTPPSATPAEPRTPRSYQNYRSMHHQATTTSPDLKHRLSETPSSTSKSSHATSDQDKFSVSSTRTNNTHSSVTTTPSPVTDVSPPTLTTDNRTGMREVQAYSKPKSPGDQTSASYNQLSAKPDKREKPVLKPKEPSTLPLQANTPDASSVNGIASTSTPPNSRKLKGSKRSYSKVQKSPQIADPQPSPTVGQTSPALVATPQKSDHLQRKESESSIKSTDSESLASSADKSDEREDTETTTVTIHLESDQKTPPQPLIPPVPSMAKEPNTGQTVSFTENLEIVDPSAGKRGSGLPPDTTALLSKRDQEKEKDRDSSNVPVRVKGKKKLRQQQKKEEKIKRKEREKEREREREREKERIRVERLKEKEFNRKQASVDDSCQSSNSTDQLEEDQQLASSQELEEQMSEYSPTKHPTPTVKAESKPTSPTDVSEAEPRNGKLAEHTDVDTKPAGHTSDLKSEGSEASESPSPPPPSQTTLPESTAFPSGAIKATQSRSTKPHLEEILSDPFSRTPDRSTYASKKSSTRKNSDKSSKPPVVVTNMDSEDPLKRTRESTPANNEADSEFCDAKESPKRPHSLEITETSPPEIVEDAPTSSASSQLETDGLAAHTQQKLSLPKNSPSLPTSPHELAASLLSNNSAINRRKQKDYKDEGSEENFESRDPNDEPHKVVETELTNYDGVYPSGRPYGKRPNPDRSPRKFGGPPIPPPLPPFHHIERYKAPSTLSLDAEPFYPTNPNFNPKHRQHSRIPRKFPPGEYNPHMMNIPPGFSSDDTFMGAPQAKAYRREYTQHRGKSLTPSPPYSGSMGDYPYAEHPGMEGHDPSLVLGAGDLGMYEGRDDAHPVYGSVGSGGNGRYGDQRRGPDVDPHLTAKGSHSRRTSVPYPESYMGSLRQQQHPPPHNMAAHHSRSGKERYPPGFTVTGQGSLWEHPNSYRLQPLSQDDDSVYRQQKYLKERQFLLRLYHQERAAVLQEQAREQARRSVETISSLNQPQRSERSSYFGSSVSHSPASSPNLWEGIDSLHEPLPPPAPSVEGPLTFSDAYSLRHHHNLLQDQPPMKSSARRRTFSTDSDLGGELVPGLQSQLDVPPSVGHPGLNRAPGKISRSEQQNKELGNFSDQRSSGNVDKNSDWLTGSADVSPYTFILI